MKKYALAALSEGSPCVTHMVFCPPAPSSTSWLVKDAPGGGTGMNGALHAHSSATAPSSVASLASLRRIAFMTGIASTGLQQQGARRPRSRGNSGPAGRAASTELAASAT